VRERIAKGLVDKGILRTQKHSFYLFDMATHPLVDSATKVSLVSRVIDICCGRGTIPNLRETALIASAAAGCVIEGALFNIEGFGKREMAFNRAEEILKNFVKTVKNSSRHKSVATSDNSTSTIVVTPATEIVAAVLQVFCRLDTLFY
jgi:golgi phosphoprotein 3